MPFHIALAELDVIFSGRVHFSSVSAMWNSP